MRSMRYIHYIEYIHHKHNKQYEHDIHYIYYITCIASHSIAYILLKTADLSNFLYLEVHVYTMKFTEDSAQIHCLELQLQPCPWPMTSPKPCRRANSKRKPYSAIMSAGLAQSSWQEELHLYLRGWEKTSTLPKLLHKQFAENCFWIMARPHYIKLM